MKKILIVEDDPHVAKALELRVRYAGYRTQVVGDGYAGVQAVARNAPDLVLLDINLPVGNGFTVAERIRKLTSQHVPIVFITASKKPEFFTRAMSLNPAGYIEKPYTPANVLALLDNVLNQPVR